MEHNQNLHLLKSYTRQILDCQSDIFLMKESVDQMYKLFYPITGIGISENQADILLSSGKAISPSAAAHCLLEMKRTAIFLRGINKAINDKLTNSGTKPIHLLYAGCGPYATLITPLLSLYAPNQVQVDLLDINEESLNASKNLACAFGFDDFIAEYYLQDATKFIVQKPYDIVLSETMTSCLRNEPQVAIMQNLVPQIHAGSIFIPEEISIDAWLTNPKTENDRLICFEGEKPPFDRISLGNVFKVNREKLDIKYLRNTLPLPDDTSSFPELKLFTSIRVFGDETLGENDCSLNIPLKYYDFRAHTGKAVEFWYEQGATPGINCRLEGNELTISKPGKYPRPDYFKLWQEQQNKLLKNERCSAP